MYKKMKNNIFMTFVAVVFCKRIVYVMTNKRNGLNNSEQNEHIWIYLGTMYLNSPT